ncbi:hypothetical protein K523DRAFT_323495 [Schizophyllum commune Tattone D]|nr:hypothetical protein K523DRAFT_323495 [Schizophyllum commune Tattone D]
MTRTRRGRGARREPSRVQQFPSRTHSKLLSLTSSAPGLEHNGAIIDSRIRPPAKVYT